MQKLKLRSMMVVLIGIGAMSCGVSQAKYDRVLAQNKALTTELDRVRKDKESMQLKLGKLQQDLARVRPTMARTGVGRGGMPGGTKGIVVKKISGKPIGPDPYLGNPKGKVVIEVYGSFQCPYTRRLAPTLVDVAKAFPKKVKVVWRDFPLRFHKRAIPAATAAREIYQQQGSPGFLVYMTKLFDNSRNLTELNLLHWAAQQGANKSKVQNALSSHKYQKAIMADMARARSVGVRGTPTILINAKQHKGSRTLAAFKKIIKAL